MRPEFKVGTPNFSVREAMESNTRELKIHYKDGRLSSLTVFRDNGVFMTPRKGDVAGDSAGVS